MEKIINGTTGKHWLVELDGGTRWTASVYAPLAHSTRELDEILAAYREQLDTLKTEAQERIVDGPCDVSLEDDFGTVWDVLPYAKHTEAIHYSWTLRLAGLTVSLHRSPHQIARGLRVEISAGALRCYPLPEIDELVSGLLKTFGLAFRDQTYSRLDVNLTTSLDAWAIDNVSYALEHDRIVTSFKRLVRDGSTCRKNKVMTWGKYPGTEFQCYDKTKELDDAILSGSAVKVTAASEKLARLVRYLGDGRLTRYEWRFHREHLRNSGVNTTADVLARLPSLVRFAMSHKVRVLCRKPSEGNSSRTPEAAFWVQVRDAFVAGCQCLAGEGVQPEPLAPDDIRRIMRPTISRGRVVKTAAAYIAKASTIDRLAGRVLDMPAALALVDNYRDELAAQLVRKLVERNEPRALARRVDDEQRDLATVDDFVKDFAAFEETDEHLAAPAFDQTLELEFEAVRAELQAADGVGEGLPGGEDVGASPAASREVGLMATQAPEAFKADKLLATLDTPEEFLDALATPPEYDDDPLRTYDDDPLSLYDEGLYRSDVSGADCDDDDDPLRLDDSGADCDDDDDPLRLDGSRDDCDDIPRGTLIDAETWEDIVEARGGRLPACYAFVPSYDELLASSPLDSPRRAASRSPLPSPSSPSQPTAATTGTDGGNSSPLSEPEEAPKRRPRKRDDRTRQGGDGKDASKPLSADGVGLEAALRSPAHSDEPKNNADDFPSVQYSWGVDSLDWLR